MEQITMVKDAIHRPDEPRHFMQFTFPETTYVATVGARQIAKTNHALVLSEVGYSIYPPVVYFPTADVTMAMLRKVDKTTHCPLKGDTDYYDYVGDAAEDEVAEVAWRYARPLDFASALADYLAFDPRKVRITST